MAAKSRAYSAGAVKSHGGSDLIEAIQQQLDVDASHAELPGQRGVGHPKLPVVPDRIAGGSIRYLHPAGLQSCLLSLQREPGSQARMSHHLLVPVSTGGWGDTRGFRSWGKAWVEPKGCDQTQGMMMQSAQPARGTTIQVMRSA